jgi:RimJ/RimL family protein N-acetyltransferase
MFELLNTPKWLQYIGDRNVRSVEDAMVYIQNRMEPQLQKLGFSNYTLIRKSDQAKIGVCGLYDREGLEGVDIGFAFLPAYESQGYAFEAASEVMRAGLEEFGIKLLKAITTKENAASQRLLEKLGFRYSQMVQLPNDEEELLLYEFRSE